MSFRSAWRHASKTSPQIHTATPSANGTVRTSGTSEPTLVVNNSRPPSIDGPKDDAKQDTNTAKTDTNPAVATGSSTEIQTATRVEPAVSELPKADGDAAVNADAKGTAPKDASWFPWWSSAKSETASTSHPAPDKPAKTENERPKSAPEPSVTAAPDTAPTQEPPVQPPSNSTTTAPISIPASTKPNEAPSSGSYLGWLWSSRPATESTQPAPEKAASKITANLETNPAPPKTYAQVAATKPAEVASSPTPNPLITTLPQTKSSWMSFWARSDSMPDLKRAADQETIHVPGEVDSQGRPYKKHKSQDETVIAETPIRPEPSKKTPHTPSLSTTSLPATPNQVPTSPARPGTPSKTLQKGQKDKSAKDKVKVPPPPNHVLPEFETVYPSLPGREGFLTRMTRAILPSQTSLLGGAIHTHPRRTSPFPIRKAVAIGIHGFFPLRILRSVLGEPTGTSIKFATLASEAIHRYSQSHFGSASAVEVVKIALEGEGTVSARVDLLWKNLSGKKEWMDHVREADLILVACHSQGSPVGAGIMAKLVEEGIVEERTRLGLLCIAGIHLGPAMEVGQKAVIKAYNAIESEAARELYEFQDSDSKVSRKYVEALRTILAHDTRVTFIGSIDDQMVPMYSSTFSTAYHGAIYRAVFIDGRIHENDFLARLVAFSLRLRNEGWRDHGVMTELSSALMGNFYTGAGHSVIYEEPAIYDLALRNTLETSSMKLMPLHIEPFKARTTPNPYLLPWSLRGVFEETIRGPLNHELDALKEEFAKWDPKSPKLKDLKWRMEGWSTVRPKM